MGVIFLIQVNTLLAIGSQTSVSDIFIQQENIMDDRTALRHLAMVVMVLVIVMVSLILISNLIA